MKFKESFIYLECRYWIYKALGSLHIVKSVYVLRPYWFRNIISSDIKPLFDDADYMCWLLGAKKENE